jgi:hypothetical protein
MYWKLVTKLDQWTAEVVQQMCGQQLAISTSTFTETHSVVRKAGNFPPLEL